MSALHHSHSGVDMKWIIIAMVFAFLFGVAVGIFWRSSKDDIEGLLYDQSRDM